ncbi:DUF5110 domain-containing protein, partial [bacterium]|nr:DUF5110 domain-containing protein [bacterium]
EILAEKFGGGKIFTPATVMDEDVWHVQQLFDSPADEGFYGLGQHQNGVFNWKGHDVDLWQYNTVAVVPFLVSSRNYGILWDNNSRTKFGDIRDYQPLSSLTLYGKDGQEGGLTAEYFGRDTETPQVTRQESEIEYAYVNDFREKGPEGYRGRGLMRWSGEIESDVAGMHKFKLYACGYMKLWLNGELVVDAWRQTWLPWTYYMELDMEPGERYPITLEIREGSNIALQYLTPQDEVYDTSLSLWSEVADQIDYYFIKGDNADEVIAGYREVTGQAPMMPKWAMGMWQSRQRYETQDQVLDAVREFRKRDIPFDNIVLDWFYWREDNWGDHEFDPERFPDPKGMVDELHTDLDAQIMISVWPKFYASTENFAEFNERGWLYQRDLELNRNDWVGYLAAFYDPYSKGARDLFWEQINDKLFSIGIDAWWLDATEPEPQSNLPEKERRLTFHPTALGTAARYLNTYSLMNAKGIYEGQRQAAPDQRVFILTRSAFAGQQRFAAATWSGDLVARWDDLRMQVPAGLNICIAGIPYWTTDIGGFSVERRFSARRGRTEEDTEEWREFMTRWFQFGAFCPLLRVHGEYPYREIYETAPDNHPAYQTMVAYDKLRYRLLPYLYSMVGDVTQNHGTMMRALVMDFGDDENVLDIGDQYMFGPAIMVNPVTAYKVRSREVYLPAGTGWFDLKTGAYHDGGRTIEADAPYSDIPLFVRAGSIIPFGPEIEYIDEKAPETIRLMVYTGADGEFTLYEDENVNYNYENGAFATIAFSYDDAAGSLTIGAREGSFPGMLENRTFEIVTVSPDQAKALNLDSTPDQTVAYDGSEVTVSLAD